MRFSMRRRGLGWRLIEFVMDQLKGGVMVFSLV